MRRRPMSPTATSPLLPAIALVAMATAAPLPCAGQTPTEGKCERLVAALSGRGGDVASPQAQGLARAVPELPVCGAILTGSKASCAALGDQQTACENRWFVFNSLRTKPTSRGFIFPEIQQCANDPRIAKYCDGLRAATESGDPDKCPKGPVEATCRAAVSLDPALCDRLGESEREDAAERVRACKERIARFQPLTKGLEELATSGPEADRPLARAALGQKDACAAYETQALAICAKGIPTLVPTPAPTPIPPTPVPATAPPTPPAVGTPRAAPTAQG